MIPLSHSYNENTASLFLEINALSEQHPQRTLNASSRDVWFWFDKFVRN